MATVHGPFLSLTASGTMGPLAAQYHVGGAVIRKRRSKSGKVKSLLQRDYRTYAGGLLAGWSACTPQEKESWVVLARPRHISNQQQFFATNQATLQQNAPPSAGWPPAPTSAPVAATSLSVQINVRGAVLSWTSSITTAVWLELISLQNITDGSFWFARMLVVQPGAMQSWGEKSLRTGDQYAFAITSADRSGSPYTSTAPVFWTGG